MYNKVHLFRHIGPEKNQQSIIICVVMFAFLDPIEEASRVSKERFANMEALVEQIQLRQMLDESGLGKSYIHSVGLFRAYK